MSVLQGGFLPGIFFFPHPSDLQTGDLDEPCLASFQCTYSQSLLRGKDKRVAFKYLNKWMTPFSESADTWTTVLSSCQQALLSTCAFWKLCCLLRCLKMVIEVAAFCHPLWKLLDRVWTFMKEQLTWVLGCMDGAHEMSCHVRKKCKGEQNPKLFFSW